MSDDIKNTVRAVAGDGFVASWRGQKVKSVGGALHHFATERDAWDFLRLCDAADGIPAIAAGTPAL